MFKGWQHQFSIRNSIIPTYREFNPFCILICPSLNSFKTNISMRLNTFLLRTNPEKFRLCIYGNNSCDFYEKHSSCLLNRPCIYHKHLFGVKISFIYSLTLVYKIIPACVKKNSPYLLKHPCIHNNDLCKYYKSLISRKKSIYLLNETRIYKSLINPKNVSLFIKWLSKI